MRQPSFSGYLVSVPLFRTHSKVPKLRLGPTAGGFSFGEKEKERLKVEVRGPRWQFEFQGRSFAFAASPEWGMLGRASRVLRVSQALHPQAGYLTYHFVQ